MGQDYYCDVLDHEDCMMDYDVEDPFKQDALKELSLKVKSALGKKTTMANAAEMVSGKTAGTWDMKQKTELKHTPCSHMDMSVTVANKDITLKASVRPDQINGDGMDGSFQVEAKCAPAKNAWEAKAEFKVGGFELGPIKPWTEIEVETNEAKEHKVSLAQNYCYEGNAHVAWKSVVDVKSKTLSECYGLLSYNHNNHGSMWFRSNCMKNFVGLGVHDKINEDLDVAAEAQWDFKKSRKGMFGQPLFLRMGATHKGLMNVSSNYMFNISDQLVFTMKHKLALTETTSATFSERVSCSSLSQQKFDLGVAFEVKL